MPSPFTKILVAWDGSAGAARGLELALQLSACDTGRVTAVAVVPGFAHVEDASVRERAVEDMRAPLREAFDAIVAGARTAAGQRASLCFVEGADPGRAVERYSEAHPVDLLIVGLHGREGLLHPRMGHVASHAVQASGCPVLVVPEPDGAAVHSQRAAHDSRIASLFHPFRHREPAD
jgi:nucleotide-binding universal stress UspA family protein